MNKIEQQVANRLKADGWTVLTSGWPDILAVRKQADGKIRVSAFEIKSSNDAVKENQKEMHNALRDAGLDVSVLRIGKKKIRRTSGVY